MSFETERSAPRLRWRSQCEIAEDARTVAEETPIAIVHDGTTTAVMMATPADLEDFAVGFSLSEGIIDKPADIRALDIVEGELGVELRLWLTSQHSGRLAARRRQTVGPTGCGLCGVDSLAEATRPPPRIASDAYRIDASVLPAAMARLEEAQVLGARTRAVHAAGLWRGDGPLIVREDVGRHNALDKLIGAVARTTGETQGMVLLTSRVSVEMVQKTAWLGAPVLCAVSAPTALAIRVAEAANLTLVGIARHDGFEVFTAPHRILF